MTDRDTFAAAALTGLLAAPTDKDRSSEYWARFSYEIADAMLRERDNHPAKPDSSTNHDAAPAARARTDAESDRTYKAALRPGEGTGNTQEPRATQTQGSVPCEGSVPDSRTENEPVAWAVVNADFQYVSLLRESAEYAALNHEFAETVPLYRHPQSTLTDAERRAIELAIESESTPDVHYLTPAAPSVRATLRGLLERLK